MSARTVLVVDDDPDIRELARLCLEIFGRWTVLTAADGHSAIATAQAERPDAVLLDMMMPGMDGLVTLQHLRAASSSRDIPVILFTAKSRVGHRQPWDGQPVSGVIAKPFEAKTLATQVADLLGWVD